MQEKVKYSVSQRDELCMCLLKWSLEVEDSFVIRSLFLIHCNPSPETWEDHKNHRKFQAGTPTFCGKQCLRLGYSGSVDLSLEYFHQGKVQYFSRLPCLIVLMVIFFFPISRQNFPWNWGRCLQVSNLWTWSLIQLSSTIGICTCVCRCFSV